MKHLGLFINIKFLKIKHKKNHLRCGAKVNNSFFFSKGKTSNIVDEKTEGMIEIRARNKMRANKY